MKETLQIAIFRIVFILWKTVKEMQLWLDCWLPSNVTVGYLSTAYNCSTRKATWATEVTAHSNNSTAEQMESSKVNVHLRQSSAELEPPAEPQSQPVKLFFIPCLVLTFKSNGLSVAHFQHVGYLWNLSGPRATVSRTKHRAENFRSYCPHMIVLLLYWYAPFGHFLILCWFI